MFTITELRAILRAGYDRDFIEEYCAPLRAFIDNFGDTDYVDRFEEAYRGTYYGYSEDQAAADYAEQLFGETGELDHISDVIAFNIDWEGVGRELITGGDIYALKLEGREYAIFDNY